MGIAGPGVAIELELVSVPPPLDVTGSFPMLFVSELESDPELELSPPLLEGVPLELDSGGWLDEDGGAEDDSCDDELSDELPLVLLDIPLEPLLDWLDEELDSSLDEDELELPDELELLDELDDEEELLDVLELLLDDDDELELLDDELDGFEMLDEDGFSLELDDELELELLDELELCADSLLLEPHGRHGSSHLQAMKCSSCHSPSSRSPIQRSTRTSLFHEYPFRR